jgi:hypothetical protein
VLGNLIEIRKMKEEECDVEMRTAVGTDPPQRLVKQFPKHFKVF